MNGSKQMQGAQKLRRASVIEEQCNGKRLIVTSINNEAVIRGHWEKGSVCSHHGPPGHCRLH